MIILEPKRTSLYAWLLAVFTLGAFCVLINSSRIYESYVDVLIVPKSASTSENIDQIANNVLEIPKSLSFYDELLSFDADMADGAENITGYQRKKYWESKIETEKIDGSSIVRISVFDKDQEKAENLSSQAGLEAARIMSQYYNIKTELEMRIVDGPISSYGLKDNIFVIILKSVLIAAAAVFSVFLINGILGIFIPEAKKGKNKIARHFYKPRQAEKETEAGPISFDKRPADLKVPEKKETYFSGKKSFAPDNLPIADLPMFEKLDKEIPESKTGKKEENEPIVREATPEEVKERLNKLLRGEL